MKQITLTEENYRILNACVEFAEEDLEETDGMIKVSSDQIPVLLSDVHILRAAIEFCTRDVP